MSTELRLSSEQKRLIEQAASANNLKEYEIIANVGSLKGDNYLGVLHNITLKEKRDGKVLHLILKSAATNDNVRETGKAPQAFKREAYLYETIIPKLCMLQEEKAISDPFTGYAKCYGSCLEEKKESILMQNLKGYNFDLWDRKRPMDDQHITLVFREYARFHAASLAWRKLYPQEFEECCKDMIFNIFEGSPGDKTQFFENYFKNGLSVVEGNIKATKALEDIKQNIIQRFKNSFTEGHERFVVIHGDSWCNNMLFSYKADRKTPERVCFIDWQLSKISSPATDLAYFFCVCGSKETFPNLNKYLKTYYDVLSQNLKEFHCDPEEVFSYSCLMEEWKRRAWFGVFMAITIIKLMLSESKEAPVLGEGEGTEHILETLSNFSTENSPEFQQRLCDLLEFVVDNGYV